MIIMMRALFSGVAGLKVHQTRMDVIGNNIANINTIGFKSSRTTFSDMLSQIQSNAAAPTDTRGGINAKQVGLGAAVESIDLLFNDASPQQTGKNTDLALSGNGLFVLKNGDQSYYTRNGAFSFDEQGYYVLPGSGLRVQGWNASAEGNLNTNALATDIVVPVGKTMEATATTEIDYNGNLDAQSLSITKISYTTALGGDASLVTTDDGATPATTTSVNVDTENVLAAVITLSDGTTRTVTSGYYEVGKSIPITTIVTEYDSQGGKHEVTVLIDKDSTTAPPTDTSVEALSTATGVIVGGVTYPITGVDTTATTATAHYTDANGADQTEVLSATNTVFDNRWRMYIVPEAGQKGPADSSFTNTYVRSEATGNPEADGSSSTGIMNDGKVAYVYFDTTGKYVAHGQEEDPSIVFSYGDGNGSSSNTAVIDLTGLTQYANNTTSFPTTNGNTSGVLQSIAIDGSGIISGTYTNGLIRTEAQLAVAQFTNSAGLTKVGTTIYQESNNSGAANVKTIADFGLDVISSALEMSNVDLATEFSDMIITQRGLQANSKITTVSDEILETIVNMKR
ncbi:MAG: flagellar hook-basal body complex protein [Selenomonadaceae bacterium]|nr:flagellar hook-basal body complex protein [Selenomonadaceae bacterium]